ncbi:hypothetical protein PHLGIDRAFT_18654 [Phlebiopsis gigantea 11061_1 CR5-6]|uniref:Uncharacterized protein n=1 Tax=Phlebiopsis gigantea (strain 11061_1 CR5-6) TaxID=745531 RepID=A0A0C3NVI1_PHLG1|nr:hypothetical protein PHLGIDRAFT_18654 [Phlebiopsis gigantea 11061_1 CR5-6]
MSSAALRTARLVSLFLSFAFGVVGMAVGINGLVKFKQEKKTLLGAVPPGATVDLNTHDVLNSGYVLTVVSGLIALASNLFLLPIIIPVFGLPAFGLPALVGRTLRLQGAILAFLSVWLFATLVPFTAFFANRSAKITASIGNVVLSPASVQAIVASLGATTEYKHVGYLRLSAVLPWFAFLFGTTSAVLSFLDTHDHYQHSAQTFPARAAEVDTSESEVNEKGKISQKEQAQVATEEV